MAELIFKRGVIINVTKLLFVAQNVSYDESYSYNASSMLDIIVLNWRLCKVPGHDNMSEIILIYNSV